MYSVQLKNLASSNVVFVFLGLIYANLTFAFQKLSLIFCHLVSVLNNNSLKYEYIKHQEQLIRNYPAH